MAKANPALLASLAAALDKAADGLRKTTAKKMFGCHALWVGEEIFALVWKEGRLGFKLPDADSYDKLMATTGASPWRIGAKQMSHWVFVPESFHAKNALLKTWATKAHELCQSRPAKAASKAKKPDNARAKKGPASKKTTKPSQRQG